jgi:hypothetical protein
MVLVPDQKNPTIRGDCPANSSTCAPLNPIDADQFVSQQYEQYKMSGFVTLEPDMRLRIVAPVMKAGSLEAPPMFQPSAGANSVSPDKAQTPTDLIGYETAIYDVSRSKNGTVEVKTLSIDLEPVGGAKQGDLTRTDYLKGEPAPGFVRLYFKPKHAMKDYGAAMLIAESQGKLNESSGEFEENPDAYCTAAHTGTKCIAFPKYAAVNAEIEIRVKKKALYLPLSSTIGDALTTAGVDDPKAVAAKLTLTRLWNSHRVPVKFDRDSMAILKLPLLGGDHIRF